MKKQGMLPLKFANPSDYTKIKPTEKVWLLDINQLAPGKVKKKSNFTEEFIDLKAQYRPV